MCFLLLLLLLLLFEYENTKRNTPTKIISLGLIWFLIFGPKTSRPVRMQNHLN